MKSILLSIKPKWVAKILNGEKTIEVRKLFPKNYVGWVYIYCTKDKKYANLINRGGFLTGMVVARFWCDKVEEIKHDYKEPYFYPYGTIRYMTNTLNDRELLEKSCLYYGDLCEYLYVNSNCDASGYAIHISKLEIFDKPKELSEFRVSCEIHKNKLSSWTKSKCMKCSHLIDYQGCSPKLTKAPQNYCYIEGE